MDAEFISLLYKVRRFLLQAFPFVSSGILYIPIKKGKSIASIKLTKEGIVIKNNLELDLKSLTFLILSSAFMYNAALQKRSKGVYKIAYYIASAIYFNELTYLLLKNYFPLWKHIFINKYNLEFFENLSLLLYPEVEKIDDLYKLTIEEIYRIILSKLIKFKEKIESIIIFYYKHNPSENDYRLKTMVEELRSLLIQEFSDKSKDILKDVDFITRAILNAIDRFVNEYNARKFAKKLHDSVKNLVDSSFVSGLKGSSLKDSFESMLDIMRYYLPSFSKVGGILQQIVLEFKEMLARYNYEKISKRRIIYKKKFNTSLVVPKYEKDPFPKIFFVIDTSASISDEDYKMFVNLLDYVVNMLRNVEGYVILFSGDVEEVIPFHNYNKTSLFEKLKKRKGYGGTVFSSVIEEVKKYKNLNQSYMVIFTDGEFHEDALSQDQINVLNSFRSIVFITTNYVPYYISNLKNVKIVKLSS